LNFAEIHGGVIENDMHKFRQKADSPFAISAAFPPRFLRFHFYAFFFLIFR